MKLPATDLEARTPVWEAMSGLYLDTDTTLLHPAAAQVFVASPYSLAELRDILVYEVNPVLWSNQCCVAGIWQGFGQDELRAEILRRQTRSRWRRRLLPQPVLHDGWPAIVALIDSARPAISALTDDPV